MNVKQWEIWNFPYQFQNQNIKTRPVIILSNNAICENSRILKLNILTCRSLRGNDEPRPTEVVIIHGVMYKTAVDCSVIPYVEKSKLDEKTGEIALADQKRIVSGIRSSFGFPYITHS